MKYVIFQDNHKDIVAVFSDEIVHAYVAKGIRFSTRNATLRSAGFFYNKNGVIVTDGCSESLKSKPLPGDEKIISDFLGK